MVWLKGDKSRDNNFSLVRNSDGKELADSVPHSLQPPTHASHHKYARAENIEQKRNRNQTQSSPGRINTPLPFLSSQIRASPNSACRLLSTYRLGTNGRKTSAAEM